MGKASKNRASEKRRMAKRAAKETRRQLYKQWAEDGQNKKSKRAVLKGKRFRGGVSVSHPRGPCGNSGCVTCRGKRKVCHRPAGNCYCGADHHPDICRCGLCRVPQQKPKKRGFRKAA